MEPFENSASSVDNGLSLPNDYKIVFYDGVVDTSIADTLYKKIATIHNNNSNQTS